MPGPVEVWLRGPVPGVPKLLQPVAHSLIQVREDIPPLLRQLDHESLWARPGGSGAIGFHALHLAGSLDRLFTYARGRVLNDAQRNALLAEGRAHEQRPATDHVTGVLEHTLDEALADLPNFPENALLDVREVGRAKLPSNVLGLLFHAAEHSTRHAGQIVTLARVVRARPD